jgi:hypothetical protein
MNLDENRLNGLEGGEIPRKLANGVLLDKWVSPNHV